MPKNVEIIIDNVDAFFKSVAAVVAKEILVGYPESAGVHPGDQPVTYAAIGYWMEFGVPSKNVPARPFLRPGVEKAIPAVMSHMHKAAQATLDGRSELRDQELDAAGNLAVVSVKEMINSNLPPPLAPSTIRGRKYARETTSRRESESEYLSLVKGGMSPAAAQAETGNRSLVNSGALRDHVTYIVRSTK